TYSKVCRLINPVVVSPTIATVGLSFFSVDSSFCAKQQSSRDIWLEICAAVKAACSQAKVTPIEVRSLGFATTYSLVAVDADSAPVSVSLTDDSRRNVIVWMDHRALKQAERINSSNSPLLQYCGFHLKCSHQ
ncbi:hypothetical protein S83_029035, partial [Arachis hypogaea]